MSGNSTPDGEERLDHPDGDSNKPSAEPSTAQSTSSLPTEQHELFSGNSVCSESAPELLPHRGGITPPLDKSGLCGFPSPPHHVVDVDNDTTPQQRFQHQQRPLQQQHQAHGHHDDDHVDNADDDYNNAASNKQASSSRTRQYDVLTAARLRRAEEGTRRGKENRHDRVAEQQQQQQYQHHRSGSNGSGDDDSATSPGSASLSSASSSFSTGGAGAVVTTRRRRASESDGSSGSDVSYVAELSPDELYSSYEYHRGAHDHHRLDNDDVDSDQVPSLDSRHGAVNLDEETMEVTGLIDPADELRELGWVSVIAKFFVPDSLHIVTATVEEYQESIAELVVRVGFIVFAPGVLAIASYILATPDAEPGPVPVATIVGAASLYVCAVVVLFAQYVYLLCIGRVGQWGVSFMLQGTVLCTLVMTLCVPRFYAISLSFAFALLTVLTGAKPLWLHLSVISVVYLLASYNLSMLSLHKADPANTWPLLTVRGNTEPRLGSNGENLFWVLFGACASLCAITVVFVARRNYVHYTNRAMFIARLCEQIDQRLRAGDIHGVRATMETFNHAAIVCDLVFPVYMSNLIRSVEEYSAVLSVDVLRAIATQSVPAPISLFSAQTVVGGDDGNNNSINNSHTEERVPVESVAQNTTVLDMRRDEGDDDDAGEAPLPPPPSRQEPQEQQLEGDGVDPRKLVGQHKQQRPSNLLNKLPLVPLDDVTILHLSIVQCAALFEFGEREPAALAIVRGFVDRACEILTDHHAVILEVQENGTIVAQWGAPRKCEAACALACCAALHIQAASRRHHHSGAVSKSRQKLLPLTVNIGIHHGPALVGSIGSSSRRAYTAIGQAPTVASALCRLNLQITGCCVIVSNTVADGASAFMCDHGCSFVVQWLSTVCIAQSPPDQVFVALQLHGVFSGGGGGGGAAAADGADVDAFPLRAQSSRTPTPPLVRSPALSGSLSGGEQHSSSMPRHGSSGGDRSAAGRPGKRDDGEKGEDEQAHVVVATTVVTSCFVSSFSQLVACYDFDSDTVRLIALMDDARASFEVYDFGEAASKYAQALSMRAGLRDSAKARLNLHGLTRPVLKAMSTQCAAFAKRGPPRGFKPILILQHQS